MGQQVSAEPRERTVVGMLALFVGVLLLVVVVGGVAVLGYRLATGTLVANRDYTGKRTFAVGATPRLTLRASGDDVVVRAGAAGTISVTSDRRVRGILLHGTPSGTAITSRQQGDEVSLDAATAEVATAGSSFARVTVTVPAATAVDVVVSRGDVLVENLQSVVTVASRSGEVSLRGVALRGASSITASGGDVSFAGTLDGAGSYRFQTSGGDVRVALPATASFALGVPAAHQVHNAFGADQVGAQPRPPLLISTPSGDVSIASQR